MSRPCSRHHLHQDTDPSSIRGFSGLSQDPLPAFLHRRHHGRRERRRRTNPPWTDRTKCRNSLPRKGFCPSSDRRQTTPSCRGPNLQSPPRRSSRPLCWRHRECSLPRILRRLRRPRPCVSPNRPSRIARLRQTPRIRECQP